MAWTAYDLGSSGYDEASSIAIALMKNYNTRVRISPSATSIDRLLPLATGRATYGFLANEVYFATEGTYEFSDPSWGPQDLRIVLGRLAGNALVAAGDAGVETLEDLKGKRIGYVKGDPSVNVRTDAFLSFAGLRRDHVRPVWFGSYGAMADALITDQIDAFATATTSANMQEIEAGPRGITWPEFPPENQEGWQRIEDVASFFAPLKATAGAGISEENPKNLVGYRYPMITTYARTRDEEVYNFIKAVDESFDDYKWTTGSSGNWAVEIAGKPPADAPWHEGAIRYLKEVGVWDKEAQAWQDQRMNRLDNVSEAWGSAKEEFQKIQAEERAKGNMIDAEEAWSRFWEKYREKSLGVRVSASRIFAGPRQFPPEDFAAYAILASWTDPRSERERFIAICMAYTTILTRAYSVLAPEPEHQLVTVWPVDSANLAQELTGGGSNDERCVVAVDRYDLEIAREAMRDAEAGSPELRSALAGRKGPFLIAWNPSEDKGESDVPIFRMDLSNVRTQAQAEAFLRLWRQGILDNAENWLDGWHDPGVRMRVRLFLENKAEDATQAISEAAKAIAILIPDK